MIKIGPPPKEHITGETAAKRAKELIEIVNDAFNAKFKKSCIITFEIDKEEKQIKVYFKEGLDGKRKLH